VEGCFTVQRGREHRTRSLVSYPRAAAGAQVSPVPRSRTPPTLIPLLSSLGGGDALWLPNTERPEW